MNLPLYLNVDEPDARIARVAGLADLARLPLPFLIYGDTLNVTLYLITRAGAYDPKSAQVDLARELKVGFRGQPALAITTDFTISGPGVTCVLELTTNQLRMALGSSGTRGLALQYRTIDLADGSETWLSADVTLLGEVADVTDGTELDPATYLTLAIAQSLFSPRAEGYGESTNTSGITTITPGAHSAAHTEVITVSGATATTRSIVLALANRTAGDRILVLADLPTTAGITVNFYDATTSGTNLLQLLTDDSGAKAAVEFVYQTAGAWRVARLAYPAR